MWWSGLGKYLTTGNAPDTAGQVNNEGCSTDDKVQISRGENPVDDLLEALNGSSFNIPHHKYSFRDLLSLLDSKLTLILDKVVDSLVNWSMILPFPVPKP